MTYGMSLLLWTDNVTEAQDDFHATLSMSHSEST